MKKHRHIKRVGNVVVFPGTVAGLVERGYEAFERAAFREAIDCFEQVLRLDDQQLDIVGPYAYALYEEKEYVRAKQVTEQLMTRTPIPRIEWMELYITICIHLREYEIVTSTIHQLFEERAIPEEYVKKFTYLKELNERLLHKYEEFETVADQHDVISYEQFRQLSQAEKYEQLRKVETWGSASIPLLRQVVTEELSPIIQTNALVLLHEQEDDAPLHLVTCDEAITVIPKTLSHPIENDKVQRVIMHSERLLDKAPSLFHIVTSMIEKYAIVAYPIFWLQHEVEAIAEAYVQYAQAMTEGEALVLTPLLEHIQKVDELQME